MGENVGACECAHKLCESVFVNIGALCVCMYVEEGYHDS